MKHSTGLYPGRFSEGRLDGKEMILMYQVIKVCQTNKINAHDR